MPRNYQVEYTKPTIKKSKPIEESKTEINKNSEILVYSSPFCPYCIKLKNELEKHDLLDKVIIIEDETMFPDYVKSLPYTIDTNTNKKMIGFPNDFDNYNNMFF